MDKTCISYILKAAAAALFCFNFVIPDSFARQSADVEYYYVVAQDGTGDFTTIQAAIDASKTFPDERITIKIKDGIYREKVKVHSWNNMISLVGESVENTIITYDDYFDRINRGRNSTFHTYTLLVQGNDFIAENLTIENSAGPVGQAVALHVESDRGIFRNCRILGHQDTIYAAGEGSRQYFKDCYIEGTTDFIFGQATAVFDDCTIHSLSNSYITAASTPKGIEYGFVIMNSRLTADPGVDKVYMGRPWRNYARTVFIRTEMEDHILPEGWHNWSRPVAEETTYYAEYQNFGPGFQPQKRVSWSYQLESEEAERYTLDYIFKGWNPDNELE
jgi:pectinesterase